MCGWPRSPPRNWCWRRRTSPASRSPTIRCRSSTPTSRSEQGPPPNAVNLKRLMSAHRGVFIASPEYNASITPLIKNAIDWISTVREGGEPQLAAYQDRVFALGAASPGRSGGMQSLIALRQVLAVGCRALVIPEQITIPNAADRLRRDGPAQRCAPPPPSSRSWRGGWSTMRGCCDEEDRTMTLDPRERLIVALDVPSVGAGADAGGAPGRHGVLLQDRLSARLCGRARLRARLWSTAGNQVFIDMKLHDIGNTVARGVESIARLGATFLTVHAYPQTMHAAVEARAGSQAAHPRRHRAHLLRRRRSGGRRLRFHRAGAGGRARRPGARHRDRRAGLLGRGGGAAAPHDPPQHGAGDARHPAERAPPPATRSA